MYCSKVLWHNLVDYTCMAIYWIQAFSSSVVETFSWYIMFFSFRTYCVFVWNVISWTSTGEQLYIQVLDEIKLNSFCWTLSVFNLFWGVLFNLAFLVKTRSTISLLFMRFRSGLELRYVENSLLNTSCGILFEKNLQVEYVQSNAFRGVRLTTVGPFVTIIQRLNICTHNWHSCVRKRVTVTSLCFSFSLNIYILALFVQLWTQGTAEAKKVHRVTLSTPLTQCLSV